MQEPKNTSPRPDFSLRPFDCVPHTPPRWPLCRGCGRVDGGRVLPQAQECTAPYHPARSGQFRASGFSPCHGHPWVLLLSAWSAAALGPAMIQPEVEEGKERRTKCFSPLRIQLKSYSVSTCTRWPEHLSGGYTELQGSLEGAVLAAMSVRGLILEALRAGKLTRKPSEATRSLEVPSAPITAWATLWANSHVS